MTVDTNASIESNTTTTSTTHNDTHEGVHLVVLHHGLWGNKGHVKFIADQFKERVGDRLLVVCTLSYNPKDGCCSGMCLLSAVSNIPLALFSTLVSCRVERVLIDL